MCLLLGLAFIALVLIAGIIGALQKGDYQQVAIVCGIVATLVGLFLARLREQKETTSFLNFLIDNAEALRSGKAIRYREEPVSQATEVTQFYTCVSLIRVTYKYPSRYYISSGQDNRVTALLYSLMTLVCGWWGIPFGPIYSVQALVKNFQGGDKKTVAQLLAEVAPAPAAPPIAPRASTPPNLQTAPQSPQSAAPRQGATPRQSAGPPPESPWS